MINPLFPEAKEITSPLTSPVQMNQQHYMAFTAMYAAQTN